MKSSFEQIRENSYIRSTSIVVDRKYSRERNGLIGKSLENLGRDADSFLLKPNEDDQTQNQG